VEYWDFPPVDDASLETADSTRREWKATDELTRRVYGMMKPRVMIAV